MIRPTAQSVLSLTTIILFVAALLIWLLNGGIGRLRQATGSHAGGAGAYSETWTADKVFGLAICSDTANYGGRVADGSNTRISADFPRITNTRNYAQNPPEWTTPTLDTFGVEAAKVGDARNWNCFLSGRESQGSVVTKWSVTGHINP